VTDRHAADGDRDGPVSLTAHVDASYVADGSVPFDVDAELSVAAGETLVILGPSGSGKTLVLETIGGFYQHDGSLTVGDRDVTDVPPEDRGFGFVFQDYALFPHMTVRENVAFGQRYRGGERDPDALLADLGVAALADRLPPTLSGGERQRVALARALAVDPAVILLDEPLSALDVPTRQTLRGDLADALTDVTAVYVTHNRTTARALADRIAVMHDGVIVQTGSPDEIFDEPATAFVARFTGANVIDAAALPADVDLDVPGDRVAIRPEYVVLDPPDPLATGTIERVVREDAGYRSTIRVGEARLEAHARGPPRGDTVGIGFQTGRLHPVER
jgi:putative spermidine/putrescine transport system ATP-binding protein